MTMTGFRLLVAPRTKKTSNQLFTVRPKDGRAPFGTVLPSPQYQEFFKLAMQESIFIKAELRATGVELPILGILSVRARFYLDSGMMGDVAGYYQGLSDWMQSQRFYKTGPKRGKLRRDGAGIIDDDRQIRDWDGSRVYVDRAQPRAEVYITVVAERP